VVTPAAAGAEPILSAAGSDTDIDITLTPKGAGRVVMSSALAFVAGTVSAPGMVVSGDPNTGVYASAADTLDFTAGGVRGLQIVTAATGVNYLVITPAAAGAEPILSAAGSDTDVSITMTPKGAGIVDMTGHMRFKGFTTWETLASSTTPALGGTVSNLVNITGTTQIEGFSGGAAGMIRWVRFAGALTLLYGVSLDLPTSASIVTVAGDEAVFVCESNGTDWKCIAYTRKSGAPLALGNVITAKQFGTTEYNAGNSGTSITLNFATNGQNQKLTLTGNCTATLSGMVAGQTSKVKVLTGAGSYTLAFTPAPKWPGGAAYVASTAASKTDLVTIYFDGTDYWGTFGKAFA
jgi:hypothetical protein